MTKLCKTIRLTFFIIGEAVCLFSVIYLAATGKQASAVALAAFTMFLLCTPRIAEKLFKIRLSLPLYIAVFIYIMCVFAGHSFDIYDLVPFWDKFLHALGGVVFGIFGFYLPTIAGVSAKRMRIVSAVFALCLSMALSLGWEFFEFGADMAFHTDMQRDTYVNEIYSYEFGAGLGEVGGMTDISEVTVNGTELDGGYLDLGLRDTMYDTIAATVGTIVVVSFLLIYKGKKQMLCLSE